MITQEKLSSRLEALAVEAHVTAAVVGVSIGGQAVVAHRGIANLATGAAVRPDTLFAAGSVTKVFNSSLLMTLVDEGKLDLDEPVVEYLPEFTMNDAATAKQVTSRMLLSHTAGLPGYCMYDLPKGPDVLARVLTVLNTYAFNSPPGHFWSYSNAGMLVAGRLVEVLTGLTWDDALDERILNPLGCHGSTITERIILEPVAVGHSVDLATGKAERLDIFQLDASNGPAGSTLWCDIDAMLRFGQMHLQSGKSRDGASVLSESAVQEMGRPQAAIPWGLGVDVQGLGWQISDRGGHRLLSHAGGNAGMHSNLVIAPQHDLVITMLTNSTTGAMITQRLTNELLAELFDIPAPEMPSPRSTPIQVDATPFIGRYVADGGAVVVQERDGQLEVLHEVDPAMQAMMQKLYISFPPPPVLLTPYDSDGRFTSNLGIPVYFPTQEGSPNRDYAYIGRVYRREQ